MRTATITRNTSETQITARFQAAFCALNQTYSDWAGKIT